MNFLMQKSKIAILFLSIINFQIICMENPYRDYTDMNDRTPSQSRRVSFNGYEDQVVVTKRCGKLKDYIHITKNLLIVAALMVSIYALIGTTSKVENFVDNASPAIGEVKDILSDVKDVLSSTNILMKELIQIINGTKSGS